MKLQALLSLAVCALGGVVTNGQIAKDIQTSSCPIGFNACEIYPPSEDEELNDGELEGCGAMVAQIIVLDSFCGGRKWDKFCVSNYNKCYFDCGDDAAMVKIEDGLNRTQITCPPTAQPTPRPTPAPIEETKTIPDPTPAPIEETKLFPDPTPARTAVPTLSKGKGGAKGMKGTKGILGKGKGGAKGTKGVVPESVMPRPKNKDGSKGGKGGTNGATIVTGSGSKGGKGGIMISSGVLGKSKGGSKGGIQAVVAVSGKSKDGSKGGKGGIQAVVAVSGKSKDGSKGGKGGTFSSVASFGSSTGTLGSKGSKGTPLDTKLIEASLEVGSWSASKEVTAQMLSDNALLGTGSISSAPSRSLGVFGLSLLTAVGVTMLSLF